MDKRKKITSFSQLRKYVRAEVYRLYRKFVKQYKNDGCQEILLCTSAKIVWTVLIFSVLLMIIKNLNLDIFFSTIVSSFFTILVKYKVSYLMPQRLAFILRGEFFDNIGGSLLQYSFATLLLIFIVLFVFPGYCVKNLNKAIKSYEK